MTGWSGPNEVRNGGVRLMPPIGILAVVSFVKMTKPVYAICCFPPPAVNAIRKALCSATDPGVCL
ncbi:MAG TPA: hypothetical protein VI997_06965 [Candidatus Thermoplasmatota archaeon]|nr:hypothetical protein [Candidatus Thermoplasmatota archaeon]